MIYLYVCDTYLVYIFVSFNNSTINKYNNIYIQGMDRYYYYYQIYVPNNDIIPAIQQPATQPYYSSLRPGGRSTRRRGHHSA